MSDDGRISWIDIQNPSDDDLAFLKERFGFHDVILEELRTPSARPHLERYDNYVFFVYNLPIYSKNDKVCRQTEVDFLVTDSAVITIHYEPLPPLIELRDLKGRTPHEVLYAIIQNIVLFEERQLRHIREKVERVGNDLFKGKERDLLMRISFLKRDVSEYRIIARTAEGVLHSLKERGTAVWGPEAQIYLDDLAGDHLKVVRQIEDYRETVSDFELTTSYLMSARVTEVMKTFTILSFLTFPFVLSVAVLSMNVHGNPLLELEYGFWYIAGGVALGLVSLWTYFKRKNWL